MVTAENIYDQVASAAEYCPDDYILKPFSQDTIRTRVRRALAKNGFFAKYGDFVESGRYLEAKEELVRLNASPDAKHYKVDLVRRKTDLLLMAERYNEAYGYASDIYSETRIIWAKYAMAKAAHHLGRNSEAIGYLSQIIMESPKFFSAYDYKARIHSEMNQFLLAQKTLEKVSAMTPGNYERKLVLARACVNNGDNEKASALIEEIAKSNAVFLSHGNEGKLAVAEIALAVGDIKLSNIMKKEAGIEVFDSYDDAMLWFRNAYHEESGHIDKIRHLVMQHYEFGVDDARILINAAAAEDDWALLEHVAIMVLSSDKAKEVLNEIRRLFDENNKPDGFRRVRDIAGQIRVDKQRMIKEQKTISYQGYTTRTPCVLRRKTKR